MASLTPIINSSDGHLDIALELMQRTQASIRRCQYQVTRGADLGSTRATAESAGKALVQVQHDLRAVSDKEIQRDLRILQRDYACLMNRIKCAALRLPQTAPTTASPIRKGEASTSPEPAPPYMPVLNSIFSETITNLRDKIHFCSRCPPSSLSFIRPAIEGIGKKIEGLLKFSEVSSHPSYLSLKAHYASFVHGFELETAKQRELPTFVSRRNPFSFALRYPAPLPSHASSPIGSDVDKPKTVALLDEGLGSCPTIAEIREHPMRSGSDDLNKFVLLALGGRDAPETVSRMIHLEKDTLTNPYARAHERCLILKLDKWLELNNVMYGIDHVDFLNISETNANYKGGVFSHRETLAMIRQSSGATTIALFDPWGRRVVDPSNARTEIMALEKLVEKWSSEKRFAFTSLFRPPSDVQMSFKPEDTWQEGGCCVTFNALYMYMTKSEVPPEKIKHMMLVLGTEGRYKLIRHFGKLMLNPTAENRTAFDQIILSML